MPLSPPRCCWVAKLRLSNFRNYHYLDLEVENKTIVIAGPNGSGKTNLLEALSLLSPTKGLKKAKITDLQNLDTPKHPWVIDALLFHDDQEDHQLVVAQDPETFSKKNIYINKTQSTQTDLQNYTNILWLTPFMDQIFLESFSLKRKFLDRLITGIYPDHQRGLAKLEYALRERSKLLKENIRDPHWYRILEERIAQESVALIVQRQTYLESLGQELKKRESQFPIPGFSLKGQIETWLASDSALNTEERVMAYLHDHRPQDLQTNLNSIGAHQSELHVNHLDFNRPAEVCSTGEQKALLLSMLLAHARLSKEKKKLMPILLLDEVVAHLDKKRREKLFKELTELKMQSWLTGTDQALFAAFESNAQFFKVDSEK